VQHDLGGTRGRCVLLVIGEPIAADQGALGRGGPGSRDVVRERRRHGEAGEPGRRPRHLTDRLPQCGGIRIGSRADDDTGSAVDSST
jgi:hypothetical protein